MGLINLIHGSTSPISPEQWAVRFAAGFADDVGWRLSPEVFKGASISDRKTALERIASFMEDNFKAMKDEIETNGKIDLADIDWFALAEDLWGWCIEKIILYPTDYSKSLPKNGRIVDGRLVWRDALGTLPGGLPVHLVNGKWRLLREWGRYLPVNAAEVTITHIRVGDEMIELKGVSQSIVSNEGELKFSFIEQLIGKISAYISSRIDGCISARWDEDELTPCVEVFSTPEPHWGEKTPAVYSWRACGDTFTVSDAVNLALDFLDHGVTLGWWRW